MADASLAEQVGVHSHVPLDMKSTSVSSDDFFTNAVTPFNHRITMKATVMYAAGDVRLDDVPDPVVEYPTDAVVRVVATCVCGSDLWPYRGIEPLAWPRRMGHEAIGVVTEVGDAVAGFTPGDFVIVPMYNSCGECANCKAGFTANCLNQSFYGVTSSEGASIDALQAEVLRIPRASWNLVKVEGVDPQTSEGRALVPSLLTLADVMGTGHHAAVSALVGKGSTVTVIGDGAVGLCAVLASKRLGASRIVAMSRHEDRAAIAREFGATDIVPERGDAGIAKVKEMFEGVGPDAALEAVGMKESMAQALGFPHPGGMVGFVGVPAGGPELPVGQMFGTNVGARGGLASVRDYAPELLGDVLAGAIEPGKVFDLQLPLSQVADAYQAMDERRATKVLLWA